MPASLSISGQTDWRAVLKITPEPARERSLRISSTLVGFDMKLPAPLDKSAATPLPSWLEIQWPETGGPQGSFALGSLVSSSYALEPDPAGMRLAHASMSFGGSESGAGDAQILNVGGSVQRLDLGGWLRLSAPAKDAKPLSYYMRNAKLNVAELDYLGLAFRDVSLDLIGRRAQLAHQCRRSQCERRDHRFPAPRVQPSPGICSSTDLHFDVADVADAADSATAAAPTTYRPMPIRAPFRPSISTPRN